jgi:hypothetical protein
MQEFIPMDNNTSGLIKMGTSLKNLATNWIFGSGQINQTEESKSALKMDHIMDQSMDQAMDQTMDKSMDQTMDKSMDQTIEHSLEHSMNTQITRSSIIKSYMIFFNLFYQNLNLTRTTFRYLTELVNLNVKNNRPDHKIGCKFYYPHAIGLWRKIMFDEYAQLLNKEARNIYHQYRANARIDLLDLDSEDMQEKKYLDQSCSMCDSCDSCDSFDSLIILRSFLRSLVYMKQESFTDSNQFYPKYTTVENVPMVDKFKFYEEHFENIFLVETQNFYQKIIDQLLSRGIKTYCFTVNKFLQLEKKLLEYTDFSTTKISVLTIFGNEFIVKQNEIILQEFSYNLFQENFTVCALIYRLFNEFNVIDQVVNEWGCHVKNQLIEFADNIDLSAVNYREFITRLLGIILV